MAEGKGLNWFEKLLPVWIGLCMLTGIILSKNIKGLGEFLAKIEVAGVNVLIGICLFVMMYPALLSLELSELKKVLVKPLPLIVTVISNWVFAPAVAAFLSNIFLKGHPSLITAVILLGSSPCTAMVVVWGSMSEANQEQNIVNTSLNTVMIILFYAPLVKLLTGMQNVGIDFVSLLVSVGVFILVPLIVGLISKYYIRKLKSDEWFNDSFKPILSKVSAFALMITLVLLFSMNGQTLLNNPKELYLVSIPLLVGYLIVVSINLFVTKILGFGYKEAATTIIIGSSSHFEIAIATAIGIAGVNSKEALGTTMGLFWEIPTMLSLVYFLKYLKQKGFFKDEKESSEIENA